MYSCTISVVSLYFSSSMGCVVKLAASVGMQSTSQVRLTMWPWHPRRKIASSSEAPSCGAAGTLAGMTRYGSLVGPMQPGDGLRDKLLESAQDRMTAGNSWRRDDVTSKP